MNTCNIKYNSDLLNDLKSIIEDLYYYDVEGVEEIESIDVKQTFKELFDTNVSNKKIDIYNESALEDFILDLETIFLELYGANTIETLLRDNALAREFFKQVLQSYLDESVIEQYVQEHINTDAETDLLIVQRKEETLKQAVYNVYGRENSSLLENVEHKFKRELKETLILNPYTATIYNYSNSEVNREIVKFKLIKFKSILNYLKTIYKDDTRLKTIKSMYSGGKLNLQDYNYVLNLFKTYLKSFEGLNKKLNSDLVDSRMQIQQLNKLFTFKKIIRDIQNEPDLNFWFERTYGKNEREDIKSKLYTGYGLSNYYYVIKDRLLLYINDNPDTDLSKLFLTNLNEIENPNNYLLHYVDDYFMLSRFDDLLNYHLHDNIRINARQYALHAEPSSQVNSKYTIHDSHKHQKMGFESGTLEGSEENTSATVKDILETIGLHDYKTNAVIPKPITLALINESWLALIQDFLVNGAKIQSDRETDPTETIKNALSSLSNNVLSSVLTVFKTLFETRNSVRLIDKLTDTVLLNEQHKNILYSFYNRVLEESNYNLSSYYAIEKRRMNAGLGQLTIVSNLLGIFQRNVSNNFLDTDLKRKSVKTQSKFNWDSDLFDAVERIVLKNKASQLSTNKDTILDNDYESTNNSASIILSDETGKSYKLGYTFSRKTGIFTIGDHFESIKHESRDILKDLSDKKLLEELQSDFYDSDLNIDNFKLKLTGNKRLLFELLSLMSKHLDYDFISDEGIKTLLLYQKNYNSKENYNIANYLDELFKITLRSLESINLVKIAHSTIDGTNNGKLKKYLESGKSFYSLLYSDHVKDGKTFLFEFEGKEVFFKPTTTTNQALSNLMKTRLLVKGESMKSTTRNKSGATVSNFSVSRLGSKLYQRLYDQRSKEDSPANSLLFVQDHLSLDPDPVIDGEITTATGEIKTVQELSENELFKHSILDKFYLSYLDSGKICFQPTVYSDKTLFLNYYATLNYFKKDDILNLSKDYTELFVEIYKTTFFNAHEKILSNVYKKFEKLINYETSIKGSSYIDTNNEVDRIDNINLFLKLHSRKALNDLVLEYNKNHDDKIELELDKDYRVIRKNENEFCALNETLCLYAELSRIGNEQQLKDYLNKQLDNFISDLKYYETSFKVFDHTEELNLWISGKEIEGNQLLYILSNSKILAKSERENFAKQWISNTGELILQNESGEVNPFLRNFFYIEGLFSNNLRLSLSGSEINHPDKSFSMYSLLQEINTEYRKNKLNYIDDIHINETRIPLKKLIYKLNFDENIFIDPITGEPKSETEINNIVDEFSNIFNLLSLSEIADVIKGYKITRINEEGIIEKISVSEEVKALLKAVYDDSILNVINTAEGTLFKRNVIIPATLANPLTDLINGSATNVNVAVILDKRAPVNNLRYSKSIDSLDGSARISPLLLRLENNALGDLKVGTNRKPIWDDLTEDLTSFLAKFAAFGISNYSMRTSLRSVSSDFNLFKKMHNRRWNFSIDLTTSIYNTEKANTLLEDSDIQDWFKHTILEGKILRYKNAYNELIDIVGFNKDESGNYYTIEKNKYTSTEYKVYHFFDDQGNHYNEYSEGLHKIDSLYELFIAMGGLECVDPETNTYSEFSLDVLTNFVINVGHKLDRTNVSSAKDVVQPLKDLFIAYALNSTAVKNGAKNINEASAWDDDNPLNTFKVSIKGLGILLNADHSVVNLEMTEFSLVIAACSAYGKYYHNTNELYYSLGELAFQASEKELENIQLFLVKTKKNPKLAQYELYLIVGKLILQSKSNSLFDLTNAIKQEVEQVFKINKNIAGENDLKIPFSDPSLYQLFITSITSVINNKSIKRKHPGSQYVLSPAYDLIQYFLIYDTKKGEYKQYMFDDLLAEAKLNLKILLKTRIEKYLEKNPSNDINVKIASFELLINFAKNNNLATDIKYLDYISNDVNTINNHFVTTYLNLLQSQELKRNKEWFMPTDHVIAYIPGEFEPLYWDLSDMKNYYLFKNTEFTEGTIFKLDVTKPKNLKPSLIRWRYIDPVDNKTKYMTIYDHYLIRRSWNDPSKKPKQAEILKVLDDLEKGIFLLEEGQAPINIIKGSLENTEAELILGNMYKDLFDTKNHSLAYILNQGEEYFKKDIERPTVPVGFHHLSMIKEDGLHVLISIDKVLNETSTIYDDIYTITEDPFDIISEYVEVDPSNEFLEIYDKKGGIKIGRYIKSNWEYKDGYVYNKNGELMTSDRYKLKSDEKGNVIEIFERINYITRYKYDAPVKINGEVSQRSYTLYKVAQLSDIARSFESEKDRNNRLEGIVDEKRNKQLLSDASNQIASILHHIYEQDSYSEVRINQGHPHIKSKESGEKLRLLLSNYMSKLVPDVNVENEKDGENYKTIFTKTVEKDGKKVKVKLTKDEFKHLSLEEQLILKTVLLLKGVDYNGEISDDFNKDYNKEIEDYYNKINNPRKKYTSFLASLHFISSRIPAQSLQSFMPMKCIGWTNDDNNTAYVSYILTFLQGSDYDIDKAYIMGQSFKDSIYVGWSNLFDYSSEATLMASKKLPLPRNKMIIQESNISKFNVDFELNNVIEAMSLLEKQNSNINKVTYIEALAELLHKINDFEGKYNYSRGKFSEKNVQKIIDLIKKHNNFKIKYNRRESAYKNVASSNIFTIVHGLRNRDQAYSDITMKDLSKEADASPKGKRIKLLNMINPLTKYIMQYLNLVGKEVIGIAANGEKDWFNLTYYYHNILRNGNEKDLTYLKMNHKYSRIKGRGKGLLEDTNIKHIPDLGSVDDMLTIKLKSLFYNTLAIDSELNDKYVDLLISQLLSAATDNAKELILARINGGTNLAKYYIHLMMLGFLLNDIVAFMTSPVVELIDSYSKNDFYNNLESKVSVALNILKGRFNLSSIIKNPRKIDINKLSPDLLVEYYQYEQEAAMALAEMEAEGRSYKKQAYDWIINDLKISVDNKTQNILLYLNIKGLQDFLQLYVLSKLGVSEEKINELTDNKYKLNLNKIISVLANYKFPNSKNLNTNYLFKHVDTVINKITELINDYNSVHDLQLQIDDFYSDLNEFDQLTKQANESSTLASVWLKLNLGIPQTDEDLISLINRMNNTITTREREFGIKKLNNYKSIFTTLMESDEKELSDDSKRKLNLLNAIDYLINMNPLNFLKTSLEGVDSETEELFTVVKKIMNNNPDLDRNYILQVLRNSIETEIYGNFDLYAFLENKKVKLLNNSIHMNSRSGENVSYRELAADYYNLIKASWNILDMVNRIPTYKQNINLLNYTLLQRHLFSNKAKLLDDLLQLGGLPSYNLSTKDYKNIILFADKMIIASYFFRKTEVIPIPKEIKNVKLYGISYGLKETSDIALNSYNGMDSLKRFVEVYLLPYLQNHSKYKNNEFIKLLSLSLFHSKQIIKTKLDLSEINDSISNQILFDRCKSAFEDLCYDKDLFGDSYSLGDIFMLYNLALHGTKVGGKYLTSLFIDSVKPGTVMYDYYNYLGNDDYYKNVTYYTPTKKDFLIHMAPFSSRLGLEFRTEPYVKVPNLLTGFDIYKRIKTKKGYEYVKEKSLLKFGDDENLTDEEHNERHLIHSKSLLMFPGLQYKMMLSNIFSNNSIFNEQERKDLLLEELIRYNKENKLFIWLNCS